MNVKIYHEICAHYKWYSMNQQFCKIFNLLKNIFIHFEFYQKRKICKTENTINQNYHNFDVNFNANNQILSNIIKYHQIKV